MFNPWLGRLLAAALGAFLCMPAALSQPAPATSPWAKVPALTTTCYYGADPFVAKLAAAPDAVNAGRTKQLAINKKIEDEHKSLDPMEMAARMQQWMMSNPQEATKYLQGVHAVGEDSNARMPEFRAAATRFQTEEKDLIKRYQAALATAFAPGYARFNALQTKLGVPLDEQSVEGEGQSVKGEGGAPDWAVAEQHAISRELDKTYAALCPQWWGATGQIHAWLKTYRDWLTKEFIPFSEHHASQNAQIYTMMGTPAASWKDTAAYDGVIEYLQVVGRVFEHRRAKPRCDATDCGYFL
jgi:hypothetical protein